MLDALLESSGVHLKRLGQVSLVVTEEEEGEESAAPWSLEQGRERAQEGRAHARWRMQQLADAVAAVAAAATTRAPTPPCGEGEPRPRLHTPRASRSLPCSPHGGRGAIHFHSPSRLSGITKEAGAAAPQDARPGPPPPATVSVEAAPVVLPAGEFLLTPGRRRAFLKSGTHLFGEPLAHLVRDPNTCRLALLEPSLGVPYIFEEVMHGSLGAGFLRIRHLAHRMSDPFVLSFSMY